MSTQTLIQNLLSPKLFPHPVRYCKVIETHISWVILTGDYAYKIKKPLDFQFLDFSTLEKRRFYCSEEIRLNKLLAADIYLDVVKITGSEENPMINNDGAAIEYAVKMREFSQDQLFSELLLKQKITPALIDDLAKLVADFHQRTPVATSGSLYGTLEHVHAPVIQNFDQMLPLLTDKKECEKLLQLRQWAEQQYKMHYELFKERKAKGFIRDCHGDLHLGNIILYKEKPLLFDRIEFNDDFRWTDVMADIAFLVMDLEDHQQKNYANRLINTYLLYTGDYQGLSLLPYYTAYRAMVRAKISLFRLNQPGLSEIEKKEVKEQYQNFITIAQRFVKSIQPQLFITHGLVGSGKSVISRMVVEQYDAIQVSSDVERKRLAGLAIHEKSHSQPNQGIYEPALTQKIYEQLLKQAQTIIQTGYSVVVDATFIKKSHRDIFYQWTKKLRIPFTILHCQASRTQLEQWIQQRQIEDRDPSEAGLQILAMQEANIEKLTAEEKKYTVDIDTATVTPEYLKAQLEGSLLLKRNVG